MARQATETAGRLKCPECGTMVRVRRSPAGALSMTCHECDLSAFARRGTAAAAAWSERMGQAAPPAASPAPAAAPAPARKPAPAPAPADEGRARSFGLDDL